MTTSFALHLNNCLDAAQRLASQNEILGIPNSDRSRRDASRETAAFLRELAKIVDHAILGVCVDADAHIGAMSDADRRMVRTLLTDQIAWAAEPFEAFAAREHEAA